MKLELALTATLLALTTSAIASDATAELGKPAPAFSLKDSDGKTVQLADFAGKTVVLEWFNPECPFVKYAHGKGPLKGQGNAATEKGVVWLAINSGGAGKQGAGQEKSAQYKTKYGMTYPVLVDEAGEVGKTYGARTTPHMFVIDGEGTLVYRGALDNAPLGEVSGDPVNYVDQALANLATGTPVATPDTKPYGCSVKY